MRTAFDANDIVFDKLNDTAFKPTLNLTGSVYKNNRPLNSNTEDIVTNSLGLPNADVQQGVVNVNIFAPNLKLRLNGNEDNSQPDLVRLKALTDLVIQQINEFYHGDYWFFFQEVSDALPDVNNQSYVNIRISFYSVNT